MPIKALGAASRKAARDTVDFCEVHHEGCKKHRNPDPEIWGHRDTDGRGRKTSRWIMTPEEMLDVHLDSLADGIHLLGGSREDFLAKPCRVIQMPRTQYRKRFRRLSEEEEKGLRDQVQKHLLEDPGEYHRRLYPETEQYWAWVNSLPHSQNRASYALKPLIREAMARGHNPYTDGPELDRHTQDVREGYGDAVPEIEEME